jgi:hypothetical protein
VLTSHDNALPCPCNTPYKLAATWWILIACRHLAGQPGWTACKAHVHSKALMN